MHSLERQSVDAAPRRLSSAMIALAAGSLFGLSGTAFAIAEAMREICPEGPQTEVICPWYRGGRGPLINLILPPADQILTGTRSIVGLLDGYFPLSSHEVFDDGNGGSRVLIEILAGRGEGDPNNQVEVALRTRATGVLSASSGNGTPREPEPLARGVAFTSRMYAASVALAPGLNNTFTLNLPGMMASMLIMADPATGARFGLTEQADVIVSAFSYLGDYEGEGDIARIHDAIASMFGITLVAPAGDFGEGPFPPTMPELQFRTVGSPGTAFNTIAVGGTDIIPPAKGPVDGPTDGGGVSAFGYDRIWPKSGRGRTDARDWRQRDPSQQGGYRIVRDVRMGPDILAPADRIRTGTALGESVYSREEQLPDPQDPSFPQEGPGSNGTAIACGFVAGAAALLQDAYKAIRSSPTGQTLFPHWANQPRMNNTVVKALLLNTAKKSGIWTNQGNQGPNSSPPQQFTTQPLDTLEGAGQVDLPRLYENFQGRQGSTFVPEIVATLDPAITDPLIPVIRDPSEVSTNPGTDGGSGGSNDPPLSGFRPDPPLGGRPPIVPPNGPFIPEPTGRPPSAPPNPPPPSNQIILLGAIPVHSIGWDYGRIGTGSIDYACVEAAVPQSTFTATLNWNRTETIAFPTVSPTAAFPGLDIQTAETGLEFEDLNLRVYLHDGSGGERFEVGRSNSDWNSTEHVYLTNNSMPPGGLPMVRVQWRLNRYNARPSLSVPVADTQYGVAWNLVQGAVTNPGGNQPPGTPNISLPGDVNSDGRVDIGDMAIVLSLYGGSDPHGDANFDGSVNFLDLSLVLGNFGAGISPVPTP